MDIDFNNINQYKSILKLGGEEWKDIEEYEGVYEISNYGRVKSNTKNKPIIMSSGDNGNGYRYLILYKNSSVKNQYLHRLVCQHFLPNPNNLPQVNHKQTGFGKHDNRATELEWVSAKDNIKDAHKNGQMIKRYLVDKIIRQEDDTVKQMYYKVKMGGGVTKVAEEYGVKRTTLSSIMNKRSRTNITDIVDEELKTKTEE